MEGGVCLNDRKWKGTGRSESRRCVCGGVEVVLMQAPEHARKTRLGCATVCTRFQKCTCLNILAFTFHRRLSHMQGFGDALYANVHHQSGQINARALS